MATTIGPTWQATILLSTIAGSALVCYELQKDGVRLIDKLMYGSLGTIIGGVFGCAFGMAAPVILPIVVPVVAWSHFRGKRE